MGKKFENSDSEMSNDSWDFEHDFVEVFVTPATGRTSIQIG